jgi:hypothetical protein
MLSCMLRAVGSRVQAKEITDLAWLKKGSDLFLRLPILYIAVIVDLEITQFYRREAFLLLGITCIVAVWLAVQVDAARMRWLLAEIFGSRPLSYRIPRRPEENPAYERPVSSREIRAGDLVCTPEQHREIVELAESQPQQWKEQDLGKWYRPVLITHAESGRIKLGILGDSEPRWERPDDACYFLRKRPLDSVADSRGNRQHSIEVAKALTGLLDFLSEDEEREDVAVRFLASEYGSSDWSARNAILVARAANFVSRRRTIPLVVEVFRLFKSRADFDGHSACKIKLTELGRLWQESQPNVPEAKIDEVDVDLKLFEQWRRIAREIAKSDPIRSAGTISTEAELLEFVHQAIGKFRHWVEDEAGWRVFWEGKSEKAIPESNMQIIFLGILNGYCERAGLRLDREVETGRGPVDFTITGDRRIRVLVEMKKLTHGNFWHGLRVQTPIYMCGQEVNHAIFLAIRDSETGQMRERWERLEEEASAMRTETGLAIEVERIDILPKPSASKA